MNDLQHTIEWFFKDVLKSSVRPEFIKEQQFGYSCETLLEDVLRTSVKDLATRWANDYTGDSHEYRLNNAGLKLYWMTDQKKQTIHIRIGGDQATNYPLFVEQVKRILAKHGLVYKDAGYYARQLLKR